MYAANEPNFLGSIFYRIQQVELQFLMAYILTSRPVVLLLFNGGCLPDIILLTLYDNIGELIYDHEVL